jgi:predicted small lipoprotein YifL
MRPLILAAVLALAACGGPKGPHAQVPSNAWVDEDPDTGEELICQDEQTTGTNVSKVVCRTQDEINQERSAGRAWEVQRRTEYNLTH